MKTAHRSHAAGRSDASAPGVRDGHDRTAVPMMFRGGVLAALALLPIAAVVGLVARGTAGLLGAVAGVGVSALIFLIGYLGIRWVLEKLHPNSSMAGALGVYFLQVSLMFPALLVLTNVSGLDAHSVALGALAAAIVWVGGQVWGFMASRTPMFDVALPGGTR